MTTILSDETKILDSNQTGRVKWFNNKAGYGFITINSDLDVFVHHSSIKVENQQYKYLVQGEYVEFKLETVTDSKHKFQASEVAGINGGKLMCETRRDNRIARTSFKNTDGNIENEVEIKTSNISVEPKTVKNLKQEKLSTRPNRVRGEGPRDAQKSDWTEVKKVRKTPVKSVNKNKVYQENN